MRTLAGPPLASIAGRATALAAARRSRAISAAMPASSITTAVTALSTTTVAAAAPAAVRVALHHWLTVVSVVGRKVRVGKPRLRSLCRVLHVAAATLAAAALATTAVAAALATSTAALRPTHTYLGDCSGQAIAPL